MGDRPRCPPVGVVCTPSGPCALVASQVHGVHGVHAPRRDPPATLAEKLLELGDARNQVLELTEPQEAVDRVEPEPGAVTANVVFTEAIGERCLRRPDAEREDGQQDEQRHQQVDPAEAAVSPGGEGQDGDRLDGDPGDHLCPPQEECGTQLLAAVQPFRTQGRSQVSVSGLRPPLSPSQPLVPQRRQRRGSQFRRDQSRIRDDVEPVEQTPHGRVDVLRQHRALHPDLPQRVAAPEAVRSTEDAEAMQPGAAGVAHRVDRLEFDGHYPGDP